MAKDLLGATDLSDWVLVQKGCYDTQHNDIQHIDLIYDTQYYDTQHKGYQGASAIMLSIEVFNVMLSVVMLNVVMLNVVGPQKDHLCSGFVTQVCQYLVQLGTCQKLMIEPANQTFTSGANRSLGFAFTFLFWFGSFFWVHVTCQGLEMEAVREPLHTRLPVAFIINMLQ